MKKHLAILLRVLAYYLIYIFIANIGLFSLILVLDRLNIPAFSQITGEFISDVMLLPALVLLFHLYRKEKRDILFQTKLEWKKIIQLFPLSILARLSLVFAIGILAVLLLFLFNQDLSELLDSGIEYQRSLFDNSQGLEKVSGFLSFVIFGPINEELLNRAVILEYLRRFYSDKTSIIYSSIIFALAHVHPGLYLSSFVLGLILAYIYIRWKNIWYPIILHVLINLQPFILSYFFTM